MNSEIRNIVEDITSAIKETTNKSQAVLHEPQINKEDIISVTNTLENGYVSSVGPVIDEFEKNIENYTNVNHAVAMSNGTSSLHIALLASGISSNDEVLLPALTFIASANAISYCNAIPHFVDSDINNLGIDHLKLRDYLNKNTEIKNNFCFNKNTGRKIFAIMPVHVYGFVGEIASLKQIADEFKILMIEDAAEALGSFSNGKHAGTFGECGCISFNGNKIITTGGGGVLITNNKELAKKARHLSTTAKLNHIFQYKHDKIGYNYRMPAINAALGVSQLKKINIILKNKKKLRNKYFKNFENFKTLDFFLGPKECQPNFWLNSVVLKQEYIKFQNQIIEGLNSKGFGCRPIWEILHYLPPYIKSPSMKLINAEKLQKSFITIPSSAFLGQNNK